MNETSEQTGMLTRTERHGEVAVAAMAARAKAEVEARYVIAIQRPRNINLARVTILDACKRPKFAEGARYRKPVGGGKTVDGLSIRFAEEAVKAMTNILTDSMVIWEDEHKRNIRVSVTDLESNTTYNDEIIINKTVERRQTKDGDVVLGERMNSTGQKVYIIAATEDALANKVAAAKSKIIRNNGLRLVPQDILEEAEEAILKTLEQGGKDPKAETKKICDSFAVIGVKPTDLERLLGHSLESISPRELIDLRATYSAIKDNETTWADVIATAEPKKPSQTGPAEPDPGAASSVASTIDAKALANPYEHIEKVLCPRDGVSVDQVLVFAKSKKLAKSDHVELIQVSDDSLRTIASTWTSVIGQIKSQKV